MIPTPTFEHVPSQPNVFSVALRWKVGDQEFGTMQEVASTDKFAFPQPWREQWAALQKVVNEYVAWVNEEMEEDSNDGSTERSSTDRMRSVTASSRDNRSRLGC